jgi:uncharacterized protein YxjI
MLLEQNKFVVKSQSKLFSSKKSYDILDGDSGQVLGTARDVTGFLPLLVGNRHIEVRDVSNNALLFSVGRHGLVFKKNKVLDPQGELIGRFKAKLFGLGGGFHIYDKDGKHLAEMQGKMFKAEYKFLTPGRTAEMGVVSRTWGGLAKSLLLGTDTYGVQIAPQFANDTSAKILILGATIAVESIFKAKAKKSAKGGTEAGEKEEEEQGESGE